MLRKVKTFFHVFINSLLPHQPYYHKLLTTKFKFSTAYFISITTIVYLISMATLAYRYDYPKSFLDMASSFTKSIELFPSDLTISLQNGILRTNYNHPYFMWLDYKDNKILIMTIDPNASSSSAPLLNSIALLTGREVIIKDAFNAGRYQISPYPGTSTVITKASLLESIVAIYSILKVFLLLSPLVIFIVLPALVVLVSLLYVFLASSIVYIVVKLLFRKRFSLHKNIQLSMHAVTMPLILNYGFAMIGINTAILPLIFLPLLTLYTGIAVYEAHYIPKKPRADLIQLCYNV